MKIRTKTYQASTTSLVVRGKALLVGSCHTHLEVTHSTTGGKCMLQTQLNIIHWHYSTDLDIIVSFFNFLFHIGIMLKKMMIDFVLEKPLPQYP